MKKNQQEIVNRARKALLLTKACVSDDEILKAIQGSYLRRELELEISVEQLSKEAIQITSDVILDAIEKLSTRVRSARRG